MKFIAVDAIIGNRPIQLSGIVADASRLMQPGMMLTAVDPWWGTGEFIYARASGTIRMLGLCALTQTFDSTNNEWRWDVAEVPNTANLGKALCVAQNAFTVGQYGWFMVTGLTPVNNTATITADNPWGIVAAGQGGALAAGKQVLNSRIVGAATITVTKANGSGNSGDTKIVVPNTDGWFVGMPLSGTGVGASSKVSAIQSDDRTVIVTVANSAAVSGTITGTYNDGTIFYNIAHLNRAFAQGAIT